MTKIFNLYVLKAVGIMLTHPHSCWVFLLLDQQKDDERLGIGAADGQRYPLYFKAGLFYQDHLTNL